MLFTSFTKREGCAASEYVCIYLVYECVCECTHLSPCYSMCSWSFHTYLESSKARSEIFQGTVCTVFSEQCYKSYNKTITMQTNKHRWRTAVVRECWSKDCRANERREDDKRSTGNSISKLTNILLSLILGLGAAALLSREVQLKVKEQNRGSLTAANVLLLANHCSWVTTRSHLQPQAAVNWGNKSLSKPFSSVYT